MKPWQRKQLLQKINSTIYEVIIKNDEKRRKRREEWATWYSQAAMPPEHWQAMQAKQKKAT